MGQRAYGQLGRGMGTAVGSFFSPQARQSGEMAGLQGIAMGDQIEHGRIRADADRLKLGQAQQEADLRSPKSMIARALMGMGIPTENAPDVQSWLDKGRIDKFEVPQGQAGPTMPAPEFYNPEMRTKIGQQFAAGQAVQAGESKSTEDYFKGQGEQGLNSAIAKAIASGDIAQVSQLASKDPMKVVQSMLAGKIGSGEIGRDVGGGRMAAIEGRALYNSDTSGAVLDQFGGGLNTSNPMAAGTINLRGMQGRQAEAAAVENLAQAGSARAQAANSYASAAKHRADTGEVRAGTGRGGKAPAGYRWSADGASLEAIPGGPATKTSEKPLSPAVVKQITEVRDSAATIDRLSKSFKDGFASKGVLGFGADLQLKAGSVLGADKESVIWWKDYRKQAELIERHALFGAALTPTEQVSWRSADIGPEMNKDVIKTNLSTRADLARKVLENARQDMIDSGQSEDRVNAIAARGMSAEAPAAQPGAQPVKIASDADYAALPKGARFVAPDGKTGTKR